MNKLSIAALFGFIVLCFAAAALGSVLTMSSVSTWYQTLQKPSLTPPDWLFGPVWSALYLMMALAAWLVWKQTGSLSSPPLVLFFIQLALNVGWSFLFFGARRPGLAFFEILVLLALILATSLSFLPRSRTAFFLMLPYAAWVGFAAYLNLAIWRLNPGVR